MTIALALLGVACLVLAAFAVLHARHARPTAIAKRRLDAELLDLRQQLQALSGVAIDPLAAQEELARERWIEQQMTGTPIETLEIAGIGDAAFETLREHGIATLADLAKLRRLKVPTIGAKRTNQLLKAHDRARLRFHHAARRMDRSALGLGALVERHAAATLERERETEWLRIRITEIERRRAQL